MTRSSVVNTERGFTIIELLVAMSIMIGITGAIFTLINPARGTFRTQPEVADLQQRLRVGTTFLVNDLMSAGAGSPAGSQLMGTLVNYFAPIQPYRTGMVASDPQNGVFYRPDAVTIMYVPPNAPQTTLDAPMPTPSSELKVATQPNCPAADPLCGFDEGQRIIIFDESGAYDDMTLTEVQASSQHLQHNKSVGGNTLSKAYDVGTQVAQIAQRTYYLDAVNNQLMYYDGDQLDVPVVDNVVDLVFEYLGEPRPPTIINPSTRMTSYGPRPPALGTTTTNWPAGENCAFLVDPASNLHAGRLPDLNPGAEGLVVLTKEMMTNGPWCPDATFLTRYDADLLRIRKIGVRLRVQVASSELRGPAGLLFRNGGTSPGGNRLVPDQEVRFEISPRNFNLGR